MAVSTVATNAATQVPGRPQAGYVLPMALMVSLYFSIGFITALNDILVPHFKDLFHLSNVLALLVQFCFFGAYFLMSVPSGAVVGRIGYKSGIVAALATMGVGLLLFVPASVLISYPVFLFALFVVGSGLSLLQVAVNPYVGVLGKPETAASRLNLCGFMNALAGTIAPRLGARFIFIAAGASAVELAHSVRTPYVLLAVFTFLVAGVTLFMPLPELIEKPVGVNAREGRARDVSVWSFPNLRLGAVAIFTYVGAEVAIGSILVNYLGQPSMGGLSHTAAASYVSFYWGGSMVGRLIGFFALMYVRAERALLGTSAVAVALVAATVFGHGHIAGLAVVACGLFNSVMWPCIFPLAVEGLGTLTSKGSGILVTMVVGGAIIPEIQGLLADRFGYQHSFIVILLCYAYLIHYAISGYKPKQEARA